MKVGVLSDTHGKKDIIEKVLNKMDDVDIIIHAGDIISDAKFLAKKLDKPVHFVAGNCDFYSFEPLERIFDIEGKKVFVTHGHIYNVKSGHNYLLTKAKNCAADIVIFGHTHIPENTFIDKILLFNPGSTSLPKGGKAGTFGILEIKEGDIKSNILTL